MRLLRDLDAVERTIVAIGSHDPVLDLAASLLRARDPAQTLVSGPGRLARRPRRAARRALPRRRLPPARPRDRRVHAAVDRARARRPAGRGRPARAPRAGADRRAGQPARARGPRGPRARCATSTASAAPARACCSTTSSRAAGSTPAAVDGYEREEPTHLAVAAAVAAGRADAGLGVLAAARAFGLDFVPVAREPFDLVMAPGEPAGRAAARAARRRGVHGAGRGARRLLVRGDRPARPGARPRASATGAVAARQRRGIAPGRSWSPRAPAPLARLPTRSAASAFAARPAGYVAVATVRAVLAGGRAGRVGLPACRASALLARCAGCYPRSRAGRPAPAAAREATQVAPRRAMSARGRGGARTRSAAHASPRSYHAPPRERVDGARTCLAVFVSWRSRRSTSQVGGGLAGRARRRSDRPRAGAGRRRGLSGAGRLITLEVVGRLGGRSATAAAARGRRIVARDRDQTRNRSS